MFSASSNTNRVIGVIRQKLEALQRNPDQMLRTVALSVLPEMKSRIHVEGKDSNGGQIGTYSPSYMKVRTGQFGNSGRFVRGAKKGEVKDAGKFSKGVKSGESRPKYNRTSDTKVILSLTRQMENDLSVGPSGNGYGIGFNNTENFNKSQWNEATYKKKIFSLTKEEKELAKKVAEDFISQIIKS